MRLAVAGVKGSPGTTTFAFGLAAAAARAGKAALLVEADPDGGAAAIRLGLAAQPGLASLAAAGRHELSAELVRAHCQALDDHLGVMAAPSAPHQARACLGVLAARLGSVLDDMAERSGAIVVVDVGRLDADSPAIPLTEPGGAVWVLSPTLEAVDSAAARLGRLEVDPERSWLVTVGEGPYGLAEIADHLGLRPLAALGQDPGAAARLWLEGGSAAGLRGPLGRTLAGAVTDLTGEAQPAVRSEPRAARRAVVEGAAAT